MPAPYLFLHTAGRHDPAHLPKMPKNRTTTIAQATAAPDQAVEAADALFYQPRSTPPYDPSTPLAAKAAVERFAHLFASAPGIFKAVLDGAREGAETLSHDRLQGISELVQNADDAGATRVLLALDEDFLTVAHDGRPVNLKDVLALATPWLTTKRDDALATGRFGIGLMTLRSISHTLDVYSGPYAMQLGAPTLSWVDSSPPDVRADWPASTVLRLPLSPGALEGTELEDWLERWDDTALLFCSNVSTVEVQIDGEEVRSLRLRWQDVPASTADPVSRRRRRRLARSQDGRRWIVHTAEVESPEGVTRLGKATGGMTSLGVALPTDGPDTGHIYAGLPLVRTDLPFRIHAQFDPTTDRQDLASTKWNRALYPLISALWASAMLELFEADPAAAWQSAPLPPQDGSASDGQVGRLESELLEAARNELSREVRLTVGGASQPLREIAVEVPALTGVVTEQEIARLASVAAALPSSARDPGERWRAVLEDWRSSTSLPAPVEVIAALPLLGDTSRSPSATIALAAAGLEADLEEELSEFPVVVLDDGGRIARPSEGDPVLLVSGKAAGLADRLGLSRRLHLAHLDGSTAAAIVLRWFEECGALSADAGPLAVLERLATVGKSGNSLENALTDDQADALREAFEDLHPEERDRVAGGVGLAVRFRAYAYDTSGKRQDVEALAAEAYLPKQIDKEKESFAAAAGRTPGLLWLDGSYAKTLRSEKGRSGLGALRFLRLLGAETAPRLRLHTELEWRYVNERQRGLPAFVRNGPVARATALHAIGASYTLEDKESPDLAAVLQSIGRERRASRRRARAAALLAAMGRAWDRLEDDATTEAADDNYAWVRKGEVRAFWLWQASSIAWLDGTDGAPHPPAELRRRTPGTIAVHGPEAPGYLHSELHDHRVDILTSVGVAGDPDTGTLTRRLRSLREDEAVDDGNTAHAAALYRTLNGRLRDATHLQGDLSPTQIRTQFAEGRGLVLTNVGWRSPGHVLLGDPVFGERRAFAPVHQEAAKLWETLKIGRPTVNDYLDVLAEVARGREAPVGEDLATMIECLRFLAQAAKTAALPDRSRRLALWTTQGWVRKRPVYAVEDLPLADGLAEQVPVWLPGGEVSQFKSLLEPFRLSWITMGTAEIAGSRPAVPDDSATALFRQAVGHLKEDLVRNEPVLAGRMASSWDRLSSLEVRLDTALQVRVAGVGGPEGEVVDVSAWADLEGGRLLLREASGLTAVDAGGRAIASLFGSSPRRVAHAWLAACALANAGRKAVEIRLAEERAAAQSKALDEELGRLAARIAEKHAAEKPAARRQSSKPSSQSDAAKKPSTPSPRHGLIDPGHYELKGMDGHGTRAAPSPTVAQRKGPRPGTKPLPTSSTPIRSVTPPPAHTQIDKEAVGLALLRKAFAANDFEIKDIRGARGAGADAVDLEGRPYELKVYAGAEPDEITLEGSQIQRAANTPGFFLVVVSNLEGDNPVPRVRVILHPLAQLKPSERSSMPFAGVRSSRSLVYEFTAAEDT